MKLDTNYLRKLVYVEKSLKDIEIEIVASDTDADENDDEASCGIGIKDELPLTEGALKQLCSYLKIPYPFTKQLRAQGRTNVLSYVERQLAQAAQANVVLVCGSSSIISITDEEKLHYKGTEIITLDKQIQDAVKDSQLEISAIVCDKGLINYFLFYKQKSEEEIEPESKWRWGFIFTFSALGEVKPNINAVVQRTADASMAILPAKLYSYPLEYESELEDRWNAIDAFIKNPPAPAWMTLGSSVAKIKKAIASFREVKEARSKLGKLKIDKEDNETLERLNTALQTKRITKEYAVKDLPYVPSKLWYCRATTPLSLFDVFNLVTVEATSAPNTLSFEVRRNLYMYAGSLLMGTPDLCVEQNPPVVRWD